MNKDLKDKIKQGLIDAEQREDEMLEDQDNWAAKSIVERNGFQLDNGEEIEIKLETDYSIMIKRDNDTIKIIKEYPVFNGPDDVDSEFGVDIFKLK